MSASASSSAANAGQMPAERSPSSSRRSPETPNSTSATGASMPAATCEVPRPARSRSSTVTDIPAWRARQAIAKPMMPPPTTSTSLEFPSAMR
jgi:hypothetical protein